ncbi:related to tol protein [Fusarium oxysporum]|uniref:Related to tol protein n=1 Tax=Fusarium oxysporum TaxID=5507 RepID=A0A2H3TRX6_FUSOX|nr:related to tol protein [Fusarium oxysporum]
MPTRLLDLGTGDSTTWRIIETQQDRVPYVALSHRWTENTPTLLQKNYDAYCDSQRDSILPQNYRDMLDICRAIPVRYIWIDSLCIIQDDNGADFRHEAPIMLDVYRFAFLTLMILWEFSDSTVFRECRPSTIARPRPYSLTSEAAVPSQDSASNAHNYAFVRVENTGSYNFDVNNAPINKRAWVLQERCLSRRILCLGNEELYWECEGDSSGPLIASETSPWGVPHISRREGLDSLTGSNSGECWNSLVEEYTSCQLTFEEDRLVAFSGIARAVAKLTGDTYLAGIWLETWMQDLLWEPDRVREKPARVKPATMGTQSMILPSWSWLSFSGSIRPGLVVANGECPRILLTEPNSFKSDRFDCLALLSQTKITPPDSDPYVTFHQAILQIRGLLVPVDFSGIADMHNLPSFFRITHNIELNSIGLDCLSLIPCREKEDGYAVLILSFSKPLNDSSRYFFIPLFLRKDKYQEPVKFSPNDTEGHGIIVEEIFADRERQFIRVGRWQEDISLPSQLGPLISNTIVQQRIGETVSGRTEDIAELERSFDSNMHKYAVRHASSMINFPRTYTSQLDQDRELPHFSKAEWSSISLV